MTKDEGGMLPIRNAGNFRRSLEMILTGLEVDIVEIWDGSGLSCPVLEVDRFGIVVVTGLEKAAPAGAECVGLEIGSALEDRWDGLVVWAVLEIAGAGFRPPPQLMISQWKNKPR